MSHPLKHPKAKQLLRRVAQSFKDDKTYLVRDSNTIFVCGGSTCKSSMRKRFLAYAANELPRFRLFLAEAAQKDYLKHPEPDFYNVAEFEDLMAEVATCVILFPESPGSFSELGYFCRSPLLRKKLLVINDAKLQGQDSFIALGPIELVDKHSQFNPTIQLSYSSRPNFRLVKERLEKRIVWQKRQRYNSRRYTDLSLQSKFYCICEIIRIFQCMTVDAVEYAFRSIWGNSKRAELEHLLSILVATEYILRVGDELEYFIPNKKMRSFLAFDNLDVESISLEVRDFYERHFSDIATVVRSVGSDT